MMSCRYNFLTVLDAPATAAVASRSEAIVRLSCHLSGDCAVSRTICVAEHTRLTRAAAVWKGLHISRLLTATTAGSKQGFRCEKALLLLCIRCPFLVERSRAGVFAKLWIEGCNTPALAPPSIACTRKSGSFDACTMRTLYCAQIEPGRTGVALVR